MKYNDFAEMLDALQEVPDFSCGDGVSDDVIRLAEKVLGIKFSPQIIKYLLDFSFIEFDGIELYGIVKEDFSSEITEGCMVEWAVSERTETDLNPNYIPIKFEDDGNMVFFDFGDLGSDGEPKVISATFDGKTYVKESVLAEDFGDYLLELTEDLE
ncbi:MAG: SMI1/KNR4 family protein [Ruminococcus sp.]|nr:SMI1/KNR4 family protein [Ruminococcus sp.]